jgi:hypothetical protein
MPTRGLEPKSRTARGLELWQALVRAVTGPNRIDVQGKRTTNMVVVSGASSSRKVTVTQPRIPNVFVAWELAIFKPTAPKSLFATSAKKKGTWRWIASLLIKKNSRCMDLAYLGRGFMR